MIPVSPDDSQAGPSPVAGLGDGGMIERSPAPCRPVEAGPPRPAGHGTVPAGVAAGAAAPLPLLSPGSGAALSPEGSTRVTAVLPSAGAFHDAPLPSLRLRVPEPPEAA